ncbi:suppressor APC domain-containing protein 1 isoform X2 [Ambystoma mexicanum]|uniref:suppressor APC domain-containing protein 1 isoform X2 n=1 Tax=Ambystoma mexicanum TaxID=8296 RepID=UPI0037E84DBD
MSSVVLPPPPHQGLAPCQRGAPLHRSFVRSLRTLFDILDDQQRGAVHLSEIEGRWGWRGEEGSSGSGGAPLPGVLDALALVAAPYGGYLSFPRLVAGLRMALLQEEERERPSCPPWRMHARPIQQEDIRTEDSPESHSPHRELDAKGVTRSRSINSCLAPGSRWRSRHCQNEPRRHTITDGINYETDFLADPYSNYGCLLLARIQEVNLSLNNLFSGPGKTDDPAERPPGQGFSSPALPGLHFYPQALGALQEQNQLLIQEVTEKSDRIAQLEKEKAALRKQLQESRPYRPSSHKESTFI